uniref:Ig-like domain-containing protein n=1 Tax=Tetraodon nigroviridis TaxID=99883 RepID=H3C5B8_TETNG
EGGGVGRIRASLGEDGAHLSTGESAGTSLCFPHLCLCLCLSGVHVLQRMYGCEWDDETNESLSGFYQYGYDGEDFISFNLTEEAWVAARREAEVTKRRWEKHEGVKEHWKTYLTHRCISWVQEYVAYRQSSLVRTELPPSVSLLQKEPSSPVTCMATGFYPGATLSWRRGEEELHEEVEPGEILPNPDGTFQMSAALDLSSVPPEDWSSYKCVFQLSGGQEVPTSLDRKRIRTNWGKTGGGGDDGEKNGLVLLWEQRLLLFSS